MNIKYECINCNNFLLFDHNKCCDLTYIFRSYGMLDIYFNYNDVDYLLSYNGSNFTITDTKNIFNTLYEKEFNNVPPLNYIKNIIDNLIFQ